MTQIKEDIAQGRYQVDPVAVADAILRRLRARRLAGVRATAGPSLAVPRPQSECS